MRPPRTTPATSAKGCRHIPSTLRMVGTVRDLLRKQMGVERKQVHTERYD